MKLGKAISTIGGFTMLSRVLGMARESVMASVLGANRYTDIFLVAFRLPNMFRRFFGEGAFSAGFVPLFSQRLHGEGGMEEAKAFSEEVLAVFLPFLAVFTLVGQIVMPGLVWALASGLPSDSETVAVTLSRITFPYLMLISLVSLFSGVLNSMHRFTAAAFAPALLNLVMLGALLLVPTGGIASVTALAWSVVLGGVIQLGLVWWSARKADISLRLRRPRMTPGVKQFFLVVFPALISAGVYQISVLIDTQFLSHLPVGALSHFNYADRLNQLPLGIVGTALGTAILPSISKYIGNSEPQEANKVQNQALDLAMLLTLPAAIALAVIGIPIVSLVYRHGEFTPQDAIVTGNTLALFALGLPAYVLVKVFTPAFFARKDTRTPLIIAVIVLIVNIALNFALVGPYGLYGLAAALMMTAWLNCALLYGVLHKRAHFKLDSAVGSRVARQLVAATVMGAVLYFGNQAMAGFAAHSKIGQMIVPILLVGLGGVVYFGLGWMIGAVNKDDVLILLRRKKAAPDQV
jgi:putative peptidoglycan lipid II flippase